LKSIVTGCSDLRAAAPNGSVGHWYLNQAVAIEMGKPQGRKKNADLEPIATSFAGDS